jgi:heat shock protein HtpX
MIAAALIAIAITFFWYERVMLLGTQSRRITAENAANLQEQQLYNVVEEMKVAAGLSYIPHVYIIEADYMNAFASGYSEKSAMIAVTRGLVNKLDRAELQAVVAHELSHIRHQDIKLTLVVSVLTHIMLIAVDLLFYNLLFSGRRQKRGNGGMLIFLILLRYLLPFITILLTLYLSRTREYMADSGCVQLMRDNQPIARALIKIHEDHQANRTTYRESYRANQHDELRRASYLYDPVKTGIEPAHAFSSLFSTHPPLKDRLKALGVKQKES